ncbi:MAG: ankyrin repeat domain-containing protein [Syntrophomonas sp.]
MKRLKQKKMLKSASVLLVFSMLLTGCGLFVSKTDAAKVAEKLDLAVKYLSDNNYEQAVLTYNDVIKIDPKEVQAYQGLAKTYSIQGKYDEAKSAYDQGITAVTTENQLKLRLALAGMYIDKGDLSEAEKRFQSIIEVNKASIDAYRGLVLVYQQQGNQDKARTILEKCISSNSGDHRAYAALGSFYADSGDIDRALTYIVKSLDLEVNQQEAYSVLVVLFQGKWDDLINKADSIVTGRSAAMLKFFASYSDQKYPAAVSSYKSSLQADNNNLKAQVLAAIGMFNTGDKAGADSLIKQVIGANPNTWIMVDIARYYQAAGDNNTAAVWAFKATVADEQNMDAIKLLVDIFSKDKPDLAKQANTRLMVNTWQPIKITNSRLTIPNPLSAGSQTNPSPPSVESANKEDKAPPITENKVEQPTPKMSSTDLGIQLHNAIYYQDLSRVKSLLQAGANPNSTSMVLDVNMPALYHSVWMASGEDNHNNIIKALLEAGADPNGTINNGATALMYVAPLDLDVVKILVEAGANVNARDKKGHTALYHAEESFSLDSIEICSYLKQHGAVK